MMRMALVTRITCTSCKVHFDYATGDAIAAFAWRREHGRVHGGGEGFPKVVGDAPSSLLAMF